MKQTMDQYKDWRIAVAFAEVGEWDTAREMIPDSKPKTTIDWFGRIFAAVAFAEEGLHDEALQIAGGNKQPARSKRDRSVKIVNREGYSYN
jgi:hypothetical protein